MEIDNFLSKISLQAKSGKSKEEIDKKIPSYFLKYLKNGTPQAQSMLDKGYSPVQYMAWGCAKANVSRDVALDFVIREFGSQYSDVKALINQFDSTFSTTEPDEEWRNKNFGFLSGQAPVAEFPPVSRSSYVTKMSLQKANKTMWTLTGGWKNFAPLNPGQKEFNATKRALEMFERGFSQSYVNQYISTLIDGVEITESNVAEIVSCAYQTAVRLNTLNTKEFKFGGYYK